MVKVTGKRSNPVQQITNFALKRGSIVIKALFRCLNKAVRGNQLSEKYVLKTL